MGDRSDRPAEIQAPADLRRHARWLDDAFQPHDPAALRDGAEGDGRADHPVPALAELSPVHRGASRRRGLLAAAAVLLVLGLVGVAALVTRDHRGDGPARVDVVDQPAAGSWKEVADFPFTDAVGPAPVPVWTGEEVLLVGQLLEQPGLDGDDKLLTMGAIPAFSPGSGGWRTLPPTPVPVVVNSAEAVWTGSELVVLFVPASAGRVLAGSGVAYAPATDSWRTIADPPPGHVIGGVAVWADGRVLSWSGGSGVAAYDPVADSWAVLDGGVADGHSLPPMNAATATAVWTGDELVIADVGSTGVIAFDPSTEDRSSAWRRLPDRPQTVGDRPLAWTGTHLGMGDVRAPAWMAPDDAAWQQPTAPSPRAAGNQPGAQVWVGERFLTWGGPAYGAGGSLPPQMDQAFGVDLATGAWLALPGPTVGAPPFSHAVVAGDRVFTWGVEDDAPGVAGRGTIRAAISSAGFASAPTTPVAPPSTDPGLAGYCAAVEAWFERLVAEQEALDLSDPSAQREVLIEMAPGFDELVEASPAEIRPVMEVLAGSLAQASTGGAPGPGSEAEREAATAFDDWFDAHCGFTSATFNRGYGSQSTVPSGTAPAPAATMPNQVVGTTP